MRTLIAILALALPCAAQTYSVTYDGHNQFGNLMRIFAAFLLLFVMAFSVQAETYSVTYSGWNASEVQAIDGGSSGYVQRVEQIQRHYSSEQYEVAGYKDFLITELTRMHGPAVKTGRPAWTWGVARVSSVTLAYDADDLPESITIGGLDVNKVSRTIVWDNFSPSEKDWATPRFARIKAAKAAYALAQEKVGNTRTLFGKVLLRLYYMLRLYDGAEYEGQLSGVTAVCVIRDPDTNVLLSVTIAGN